MDRPNIIFHNLDHVACDERVTAVDISHTPLEDGDADVAILCLSMWGSNKEQYLVEAHRILDPNGRLLVIEPTKRWRDQDTGEHKLRELLEMNKFTVETEDYRTEDQQIRKFSMFVVRKC
jgi:ubiquinone/menaquinone biosynthesis C-methylase UbiE